MRQARGRGLERIASGREQAAAAWEKGDRGKGLELAGRAVEAAPKDPAGYLLRGSMYAALGKSREAVADLGRLPVVSDDARRLVGILTRSDLVSAHRRRLAGHTLDRSRSARAAEAARASEAPQAPVVRRR